MTTHCPLCRGGTDTSTATGDRPNLGSNGHGGAGDEPACTGCRGTGEYLAEFCVSVVNAVTAEVASRSLVAGDLPVRAWARDASRRVFAIGAVIDSLAAEVGAEELRAGRARRDRNKRLIVMPEEWRDDAPVEERAAWQRRAFAEHFRGRRWQIFTGYPSGSGEAEEPSLDRRWQGLCAFARAACLDFVVRWVNGACDVHYEMPEATLKPVDRKKVVEHDKLPHNGFEPDLASAIGEVTPSILVWEMYPRISAPPYSVVPEPEALTADGAGSSFDAADAADETVGWTLHQVAAALEAAGTATGAAMAVWRDGRWQVRSAKATVRSGGAEPQDVLDPAFPREDLFVEPTQPLDPPRWRGDRLDSGPCPCADGGPPPLSEIRTPCGAHRRQGYVDPACSDCQAQDPATFDLCPVCRDTGFMLGGAVITFVFPDNRVSVHMLDGLRHRKWGRPVAIDLIKQDNGLGYHRLPDEWTVEHAAGLAGAPAWQIAYPKRDRLWTGRFLPPSSLQLPEPLRYGHLYEASWYRTDPRWPVDRSVMAADYYTRVTRGGPGGRAFFAVMPPADESSLGWFCSLARALGVRLDIALDPEPYPARWGIELSPSSQQRDRWPFTVLPLGEEILDRRADLPIDLWDLGESIPTSQPLHAPQHLGPPLKARRTSSSLSASWSGRHGRPRG